MDRFTLDQLQNSLPHIDFRETFGISESGIVRVKSEDRKRSFAQIDGEDAKAPL